MQAPPQLVQLAELQAIVGTELDTAAAVQTDIHLSMDILTYRINGTGRNAFPASDTVFLAHHHTASLALAERAGGTGGDTGSRVAGETDKSHKTGGQSTGRMDADSGTGPGNLLMNQAGAGQ